MAIASVFAAVINIILNYIFIPRYGYIAAAYTTLFGYFVLMILHMFIVIGLGFRKTFNNIFMTLLLIISICFMVGTLLLYKYPIIRYVVLGGYTVTFFVIIFKNKNKIFNYLRNGSGK